MNLKPTHTIKFKSNYFNINRLLPIIIFNLNFISINTSIIITVIPILIN